MLVKIFDTTLDAAGLEINMNNWFKAFDERTNQIIDIIMPNDKGIPGKIIITYKKR
jgi:hypothetical protein